MWRNEAVEIVADRIEQTTSELTGAECRDRARRLLDERVAEVTAERQARRDAITARLTELGAD